MITPQGRNWFHFKSMSIFCISKSILAKNNPFKLISIWMQKNRYNIEIVGLYFIWEGTFMKSLTLIITIILASVMLAGCCDVYAPCCTPHPCQPYSCYIDSYPHAYYPNAANPSICYPEGCCGIQSGCGYLYGCSNPHPYHRGKFYSRNCYASKNSCDECR